MTLAPDLYAEVMAHARECMPEESCGLIVADAHYVRAKNTSAKPKESFVVDPRDYVKASKLGEITMIVHSHVGIGPEPTEGDMIEINKDGSNERWLIVNPELGSYTITEPNGWRPPLLGRTFYVGTSDCFALMRDYYHRVLKIDLFDIEREPKGYQPGQCEAWITEMGFEEVRIPRLHDVFMMSVANRNGASNHVGMYLGKDDRENDIFMHHVFGHKSEKAVWGGYWLKSLKGIWRHKSLMGTGS